MDSGNKALAMELKQFQKEPIEGFTVNLVNEANLSEWQIGIFGPPGTVYEGGYFKVLMKFPRDYPFSPPTMRFTSKLWHPNVYSSGEVCISILHPPTDDPTAGELPQERWNPTQSVRTILMSVISLLNEPNTQSPANVDASVSYRKWKEGVDDEYATRIKLHVKESKEVAAREGVVVPITIDDYCVKACGAGGAQDTGDLDMLDLDWDDDDASGDEGDEAEDSGTA